LDSVQVEVFAGTYQRLYADVSGFAYVRKLAPKILKRMHIKILSIAVALIATASQANAVSIGKATSVVTLGRPLVATVPVQLGAGEEIAESCLEVSVFYGDSRQESHSVQVDKGAASTVAGVQFRIEANSPVNEPVVTLYVGITCGQKTSRRFVFLSDVAPESQVPILPRRSEVELPTVAGIVEPIQKPGVNESFNPAPVNVRSSAVAKPGNTQIQKSPRVNVREKSVQLGESAVKAGSKRARLKLVPFDQSELDPQLKMSDALTPIAAPDPERRAQLQGLWQALSATPEENLQQSIRLRALEGDLKLIQETTTKNQVALKDLSAKLEAERNAHQVNTVLVTSLVALSGFAALLFLLWRRSAHGAVDKRPWWLGLSATKEQQDLQEGPSEDNVSTFTGADIAVKNEEIAERKLNSANFTGVDIDLDLSDSLANSDTGAAFSISTPVFEFSSASVVEPVGFSQSIQGSLRAINTQEMLDVRQQADFFVTLGQYDDAIELLITTINGVGDHNPLVYIDLLKLLHSLSRKEQFERYRTEFNGIYTGYVPEYAIFGELGRDLESYGEICDLITNVWATSNAISAIEQELLRKQFGKGEVIDLEAFKDLLLLRGIAIRLTDDVSGFAPFASQKVEAPENDSTSPGSNQTLETESLMIDFDLSEPDVKNKNLIDLNL
jgi:hypothetical protein